VAEVAKLFVHSGLITICSFISPYRSLRSLARQVIGDDDFVEVYVHATFDSCTKRDPKGLYKKASEGKVAHFTGRDSVFEEPDETFAGLRLDTEKESKEESLARLLAAVRPRIGL
jgi:adenylylsulfate kinase